ncbi:polymorphic toxin-type HINT domain-containing protein, partial [Streptomyces sp. NPDC051098]|uniref:polymorphic toxin-type HINT domain-containing protein n=1 Tax=Streptomyces sp. NPDC051098 TaxID=3155411 RepID=UPI0034385D43
AHPVGDRTGLLAHPVRTGLPADQAALDAQAARDAAAAAEQSAKDARAAANRADAAATEAEQAAKDALKYAKEAQQAAEEAARNAANKQVSTGAGTGVGGTWYVVDDGSIEITDAKQQNDCVIEIGFEGCTVTFTVTFNATVDFFLCTNPDVPASANGCPPDDTLLLQSMPLKGLKKDVTEYFSKWQLVEMTTTYQVIKGVLVQDFVDCWHGSVSGCAWAASNFIPGKAFAKIAEGIRALDAAMTTGIGVADAFKALKALDLDPATLAMLERSVNVYEDAFTACARNSFPAATPVLMADGSHRPISQVGVGDLVQATDPASGRLRARQVTDTFQHDTERLVDLTIAGGGTLTSTAGHKFYVVGRGWTLVSDLSVGDRLRTPDGTLRSLTAFRDRSGLTPRTVYDLTVDDLHTFFVRTKGQRPDDVLVHNCLNLTLHEGDRGAHTIRDHVTIGPQAAVQKAIDDLARNPAHPGVTGVWTDLATAQASVDAGFAKWYATHRSELDTWMKKTPKTSENALHLKSFRIQLDTPGSLGTLYPTTGVAHARPAGNWVSITLKRSKHKPGYMVYTSHPE